MNSMQSMVGATPRLALRASPRARDRPAMNSRRPTPDPPRRARTRTTTCAARPTRATFGTAGDPKLSGGPPSRVLTRRNDALERGTTTTTTTTTTRESRRLARARTKQTIRIHNSLSHRVEESHRRAHARARFSPTAGAPSAPAPAAPSPVPLARISSNSSLNNFPYPPRPAS